MNAAATNIEVLCDWSEPVTVKTKRGQRLLRTATPGPQFWQAWRTGKAELQALGVSCKPLEGGGWEACWWQEASKENLASGDEKAVETGRTEPGRSAGSSCSSLETAQPAREYIPQHVQRARESIFKPKKGRKNLGPRSLENSRNTPAEPSSGKAGNGGGDSATGPANLAGGNSAQGEPVTRSVCNDNAGIKHPSVSSGRVWSAEQQAIFAEFEKGKRNFVVRARAGCGKTSTIEHGLHFAPEADILYAVFNKKNQREAQQKITDARVDVRTLHSLGFRYILRQWNNAKPDDEVENDRIKQVEHDIPDPVATQVKKLVGFAKNVFCGTPSVDELEDLADDRFIEAPSFENEQDGGWVPKRLAQVAMKVMELSRQRDPEGRISFNDMVWLPVAMGWVRANYSLVVVDEAQDMNAPQLEMARLACKQGGRVIVVGDDRQAIYGFRGAKCNGIDIMKDVLCAGELTLTTTYRCPKKVVELAKVLVPDYNAAPQAPEGTVEHLGETVLLERVQVGDAVLSRANAPLMPLCLALIRKGVAARIEGRDLGKSLLSIVRGLRARSVPEFLRKVESWGDKQKQRAKGRKSYDQKCEVVNDQVATLTAVADGCANVQEVETRLVSIFQDSEDCPKPAVVFSSVHKAKGLEWMRVFLLSKTFMKSRKNQSAADRHEESNIMYVAMTRSKSYLGLCFEQKLPELGTGESVQVAA